MASVKNVSWKTITVEQYQEIALIQEQELDDTDKMIRTVAALCDLTELQVEDLPINVFTKQAQAVGGLFTNIPKAKHKKRIKAGKRLYWLSYDVAKNRLGQYIEVSHFTSKGLIPNLHFIAASIAAPVHYRIFKGKNDSGNHSKVAEDFKQGNFLDTYNSVVFFCQRLNNLTLSGKVSMEKETTTSQTHLAKSTDGSTQLRKSQRTKELHLNRLTTSQRFNP